MTFCAKNNRSSPKMSHWKRLPKSTYDAREKGQTEKNRAKSKSSVSFNRNEENPYKLFFFLFFEYSAFRFYKVWHKDVQAVDVGLASVPTEISGETRNAGDPHGLHQIRSMLFDQAEISFEPSPPRLLIDAQLLTHRVAIASSALVVCVRKNRKVRIVKVA